MYALFRLRSYWPVTGVIAGLSACSWCAGLSACSWRASGAEPPRTTVTVLATNMAANVANVRRLLINDHLEKRVGFSFVRLLQSLNVDPRNADGSLARDA